MVNGFRYKYIVFTQGYIINYTNEYLIRYLGIWRTYVTVWHMMFLGVKHGFSLFDYLKTCSCVCVRLFVAVMLRQFDAVFKEVVGF